MNFAISTPKNAANIIALIQGIRNSSDQATNYENIIGRTLSKYISLNQKPTSNNHTFENFGLAKTSNDNFDLFLFAGSVGQNGKGGHAHNDKLSYETVCR